MRNNYSSNNGFAKRFKKALNSGLFLLLVFRFMRLMHISAFYSTFCHLLSAFLLCGFPPVSHLFFTASTPLRQFQPVQFSASISRPGIANASPLQSPEGHQSSSAAAYMRRNHSFSQVSPLHRIRAAASTASNTALRAALKAERVMVNRGRRSMA